jgi:glucosamine--fructose-6-phosphate aminotransferase (isomerizing)
VCGIAGCVLHDGKAAPLLFEALKRLEYRGYDSVGHATISNGRLVVRKDQGRIDDVQRTLGLTEMDGRTGLGHTRWATHGAPSKENAHPHIDCNERVAIVHNGIIENFMELRQELESSGHKFTSRTDSEVVAHLIEANLNNGLAADQAVRMAAKRLRGAYALAILIADEPEKLFCVRRESPLVLGLGGNGNFCASDIPAFLPLTNRVLLMEDGEMAVLTPETVKLYEVESGELVTREILNVGWNSETAVKMGYPHFMLKEIHEQPSSIRDALRTQSIYLDLMAAILHKAKRIYFVACGTAYHAAVVGSFLFARLARVQAEPVVASEFIDAYGELVDSGTVIVAVTQSGETMDTLSAARAAKERGATILSVTNVMGSSVTRISGVYIGQNSGPEIGVAATKTFTAQVAVLSRLAIALAQKTGRLDESGARRLEASLRQIPDAISSVLATQEDLVKRIAEKHTDARSFCFLGRGVNVATALEGRLKLLELTYMPTIAYPAGESKHGFISVVEPGFPVIFVSPRDESHSKLIGNVMEMKARGADIIALHDQNDSEMRALADYSIEIPEVEPLFSPIAYAIPLQLFAYYMCVQKAYDPDKPRHLAKSVTVY